MGLQQREAHSRGHCVAAWDKVGKHLITAGSDGKLLVHSWDPAVPSSVKTSLKPHNAAITCLAISPNGTVVATGSIDHSVQLYSYPGGAYQSTVTRFTLPIRSLAFSATGALLAAAGDDDAIKLISLADNSIACVLKGHRASVVSLVFDPKNEYMVSADSDGVVMFWTISSGRVLHSLPVAPKVDVNSAARNTLAWHPDGNLVAVPGSRNDILVLDRDTAEAMVTLKGGHTGLVSTLAWSLNGKYLASAGLDSQVVLWDFEKQQDIDGTHLDATVSCLAWKPIENGLAIVNMEGKFTVWESLIPPHMISPTICIKGSHVSATNLEDVHFSDEEDSKGPGGSIALGSQDTASGGHEDDKYESDGEELMSSRRKRPRNCLSVDDVYDKKAGPAGETPAFSLKVPAMQKPFQPGSTDKTEGKKSFLAYSLVGCISSSGSNGSYHVEVEFHDISKGVRIPAIADHFGFSMASIGERGSVFASPQDGDKCPSTLVYRPVNSWATNSEWSVRFPSNEEAKAVAIGDRWVAVATSLNFLRLFSEGGLQKFILTLTGPVVSMAGHEQLLVVVTHASSPLSSGDQAMDFMVLDLQRQVKISSGRLALSPGARLYWVGFSESGSLGSYDSLGVLRRYSHEFGGCWIPIFSVEKERNSSESFWMVGFNDKQVFVIVCKLPETQPLVTPRPILSFFNLSLPLVNSELGDELENEYLRHTLLLSQARLKADQAAVDDLDVVEQLDENVLEMEAEHDRYVLRLMAAACKGDKLARAMELALSLQLHKSLEGAVKLVNAMRLPALAERLNLLLEKRLLDKEPTYFKEKNPKSLGSVSALPKEKAADVGITKTAALSSILSKSSRKPTSSTAEEPAGKTSNPFAKRSASSRTDDVSAAAAAGAAATAPAAAAAPAEPVAAVKKASNPFAKSSSSTSGSKKPNVPLLDSLKMLHKNSGNKTNKSLD